VRGETESKVAVDIGLGAKASFEAKVSTEIPPQSTGRLLDSLTDILRPFSERRGLKADQIRLQREEVLIEIARRAHHRLEIDNQPINPLPNKFLVPFLEKASLEELDSVLIDRWADLLAYCSADPISAHPRFVQILSELTGRDATLLRAIALNCIDEHPEVSFWDCAFAYDPIEARHRFANWFSENQPEVDGIYEYVRHVFRSPGVSLIDVPVREIMTDSYWSFNPSKENLMPAAAHGTAPHLDVLCSLQILSKHHLQVSNNRFEVDIYYVCMTELGIAFLEKCDREVEQKTSCPSLLLGRFGGLARRLAAEGQTILTWELNAALGRPLAPKLAPDGLAQAGTEGDRRAP
jgi:hypothetical protein